MNDDLRGIAGKFKRKIIRGVYSQRKGTHNNYIRTEGVSFPRSGHGATYNVLKVYFGSDFVYCGGIEDKNCGCGNTPCTNPNLQFSKNHDFEISGGSGSHIVPGQQYIVQYRNPVRSIISDYKLFMAGNPNKSADKFWFPFAHSKMNYWIKFVDKWLLNASDTNSLILPVSYENLIAYPEQTLKEIIRFLTQQEPDKKRLEKALMSVQLKSRNSYHDFQFYDKDFFKKLESLTGDRLSKLSIPSFEGSV